MATKTTVTTSVSQATILPGMTVRDTKKVTTTVNDTVVDVQAVKYQRPLKVSFSGDGFRPYSQLTPYFQGVDISAYIDTDDVTNRIIADADGKFSGVFNIPANTFFTGKSTIIFTDNIDESIASSYGSTTFTSAGSLEIVNSKIDVLTETTRIITMPAAVDGGDPLAQTFSVSTGTNSTHVFITKVGLFFKSKDKSTPVTVFLKNVENGYPGSTVYGYKTLLPSAVSISANSSAETLFEFDAPIAIPNDRDYCIVVLSNSVGYNVWVSTLGAIRIDKNEAISKQPSTGVLFLSANNKAWTPYQDKDLKFKLYCAQFPTNVQKTAKFVPEYPAYRAAFNSAIETFNGTKNIRIFALNHGLQVNSKTAITVDLINGETTANGIFTAGISGIFNVTAVDSISYTIDLGTAYKVGTRTNYTINSSTIAIPGTSIATTVSNSSASGYVSANIEYEPNVIYDAFVPAFKLSSPEKTEISMSMKGISGKSIHGSQTPYVPDSSSVAIDNKVEETFSVPKMACSYTETIDKFVDDEVKTTIDVILSTEDPFVSPVINVEASGVILKSTIMNNPTGGNTPYGFVAETDGRNVTSALGKYISRPFKFSESATSIKLWMTANCVNENFIDVYYRTTGTGNSDVLDNSDWVLFTPDNFINCPDNKTFYEYDYEIKNLAKFNMMQIKFVLRGANSAQAPVLRDWRAIALAV